jgi:hypothetical protein
MKITTISLAVLMLFISAGISRGQDAKEKLTEVKASLAGSQVLLKQYEWIETTVVSVKDEEKSRTISRCYYGEDGKVQKVPVAIPPPEAKKPGIRGKIIEKKKEEMTEYLTEAVALVKTYVPPDPAKLQAVQAAGKMTIQPLAGGEQVRLTFADYQKKDDSLGLVVDARKNRMSGAQVTTYMDSDKEPVTLDVRFGTLNDTIVYAEKITLEAKGKNLSVAVENSGYRKTANR